MTSNVASASVSVGGGLVVVAATGAPAWLLALSGVGLAALGGYIAYQLLLGEGPRQG